MNRIIQALNECLAALPQQQLRKVCAIGVSGQMHGILFWKTGQGMEGSRHHMLTVTVELEKCCQELSVKGQVALQWEMQWYMHFVYILSGTNV